VTDDDQEQGDVQGDVIAQYESIATRERLRTTTCRWCGDQVPYAGVGRRPLYCSDAHRQRAYEVRTALARAGRPVEQGGRADAPVREVVERTETVTRTTVRRQAPYLPHTVQQWVHALGELRAQLAAERVRPGALPGDQEELLHALEAALDAARGRDVPPTFRA
jgi:hypothetical protein